MKTFLSQLRLYVCGPRRVEDVMKTFRQAAADLQNTADHHANMADYHHIVANKHRDIAETHTSDGERALRVRDRITQFLS